ncbi:molybdenum ABC transporter ATP-binding protein [Pararhizobium polonicum]|uniref:Molybdenum ABC transporter ATP-binding protein n=1 Tax=Pararhizobium polonicum TaxID=1612624 RepID=A0A1C7P1P7_9HYPH|nr:molybdenum ABC transporter ATP-binding protein [Pararhizobium polonicum]OBZ95203.1 molybdenum ABC transporter ATP-binding protein [Pararhizobium polonicum]
MSLVVETRHRLGAFSVEATFSSDRGVTALFGRSGSGKTSLINIIAGLLRPDSGRIVFNGDVLADAENRIFTPPHKRRFGYVFQEARLFPHLSVRQNLTYGRWFAQGRNDGPGFNRIVDMLGVGALFDRAPVNLSGGEKQRIAIGRALLSSPRLLLMDEPLAALDEERKAEILPYLERLRDEMEIPIVYVSHSVSEVARLANKVIILENGRISASGDAAAILSQPSSAVSRREAGAVIDGVVGATDTEHQITIIRAGSAEIRVPHLEAATGKTVRLQIAARDVMLATSKPEGLSALNILPATIVEIGDAAQGMVDIRLDCGGVTIVSRITVLSRDMLKLHIGKPVHAIIKSVALDL